MNEIDMASANVNFEEILDKSLTQKERDLLWEILNQKDERTELQKLLDKHDMYVWDEQGERKKLIEKLKNVEKCKDVDELNNFEDRIKDMRERVNFNLDMQNETIDEIFNEIRNNLSE